MKQFHIFLVLIFGFAAFTPSGAQAFERGTLVIQTQSGDHTFVVDLASTPEDKRAGLMGRTDIPPDYGMLFDFRGHEQVAMWMKNTPTSLDMVFIDGRGDVLDIVANTTPYSTDIIRVNGPVAAVLELNAGTAISIGLAAGDQIKHPLFAGP